MSKLGMIKGGIKGFAHAVKSGAKRRSPEILMAVGTIGVVTATVTACVQTRKLDDILTEHEETLDRIKKLRIDSAELGEPQNYGKETVMVYTATTFKVARLYALPLTIGAASLFCFFGAHHILKKRALALAAAYNALDTGFKQYRERVANRFGEEVENQIRHGTKLRLDLTEVRHCIASVGPSLWTLQKRHQMYVVHTALRQIVQASLHALQIPRKAVRVHQHAQHIISLIPLRICFSFFIKFL